MLPKSTANVIIELEHVVAQNPCGHLELGYRHALWE